MADNIVDLCDSGDDSYVSALSDVPPARIQAAGVARAPVVLLDDDDDDDDDHISNNLHRGRKRARTRTVGEGAELFDLVNDNDDDDDAKPAARAPQRRRQKHQSQQPPPPQQQPPPKKAPKPKTPMELIHEVFPDVDRMHANQLLVRHVNNLDAVISELAERSYPKSTVVVSRTSSHDNNNNNNNNNNSVIVRRPRALPKYDYFSSSAPFEPSEAYMEQVNLQLLYEFPFFSLKGLQTLLQKHGYRYSTLRQQTHDALSGKQPLIIPLASSKVQKKKAKTAAAAAKPTEEQEEEHYHGLKRFLTTQRLSPTQRRSFGACIILKNGRTRPPKPTITDPILQDEMTHADYKLQTWMSSIQDRLSRRRARKHSQLEGSAVECSCCFDKVAMEEMVACRDEGHLFCVECIKGYAENQIFSVGNLGVDKVTKKPCTELLCCHGDGCQSPFHEAHLRKALPLKTLEKYTQMQFQAAVDQAGLGENICSCPKCGFQADLPETEMIFRCPVEGCQHESCRKCGKAPHIPLRCDEVEKAKHQDAGRLKVEEAISAAKIRSCPKCKTSFVKSEGCNKMACPCGTKMCYICRRTLDKRDPYKHFCQTPHCTHKTCGKCTLYSNDDEDDKRAMREAGITAATQYKQELSTVADVNIDVERILRA